MAPLILGFDFGLNPACVFAQMTKLGMKILTELEIDLVSGGHGGYVPDPAPKPPPSGNPPPGGGPPPWL